jgi:hypothetical protein
MPNLETHRPSAWSMLGNADDDVGEGLGGESHGWHDGNLRD